MLCVVLTQRRQVGVLGAEQEEVHSDLLTRAVQSQFLVEVRGRAEVLNSLKMKNIYKLHCTIILYKESLFTREYDRQQVSGRFQEQK